MRLSQVLAVQVSTSCRAKGTKYFAEGAVTRIERRDGIIQARVSGTEDYDVWMEADGGAIGASCTCPFFIDRLEICKHVWAVILTAEKRGIPLIEPGRAPDPGQISLEPIDPDYPAYAGDGDDTEEWIDDDAGWVPPITPRAVAGARPRKTAAWRQLLDDIVATSTVPAIGPSGRVREGHLLYVLDIDASIAAATIVVELMTRDRKANGDWGKPKPARVLASDIPRLPPGPDRQILERLIGARPHHHGGFGYEYGELSRLRLHGVLVREMLPLLCADGRCMARLDSTTQTAATPVPLQFDANGPWHLAVSIERDERARVYRIHGAFARGDERIPVSEPLLVGDGILVTRQHVAHVELDGGFGWLRALRRGESMDVPFSERPGLIDALLMQPPRCEQVPEDLRVDVEDGTPRPLLRLKQVRLRPDRLRAELWFDYGDEFQVPSTTPNPLLRTADATRVIRRDVAAENAFANAMHRVGFRQEWSHDANGPVPQIAADSLPRVVRALVAEGWQVEAKGVAYRQPGRVSLHVSSGVDWFELEGHVDYGDTPVPLPTLLAAARRGDAFVPLGDGSMGLLPEEWLRKHGALARLGTTDATRLRFKTSQAALLDALLASQPHVTVDETFARARQELLAFDGIAPADPPSSFTGTLRAYQREGLGWLLFLRRFGFGGCLADDMGLGKTVMVLALLARCRADGGHQPSLVVAPRSLVFNWKQEAARFTPDLRVLDYTGAGRDALRDRMGEHDIVLTTYGTVRRDAAHLANIRFEYVVLDESQAIKNAASASAKAARLLAGNHRLALSGTPVENHLGELWSLFEFLNPGVLGSTPAFAQSAGSRGLDEDGAALLARGLRPFFLRRTKAQVAPELPEKTEQTIYCELEAPQRSLYNELRDHYRQTLLAGANGHGLAKAKLQVLEALLRLRQAACHPGLVDKARTGDAAAKLEVLVPQIAQAVDEGHKTLVFSQFTSLLSILRARLDADRMAYEYLDGRTRDRASKVERFQTDPDCRLFLISLKAGGVGLNLTAAEYVFLLDPWWNPAVESQAIDRAHRIGQQRHVFAYRLIAKDTVEERVLQLQQQKQSLADAILKADEGLIKALKREDLELLLS